VVARIRDDERGRGKAESGRFGDSGKRKDMAFELQRELEREFMLEQLEELSTDFSDNPEQIGIYLADLEVAGLLTPADKGMIFRRLWETMGPAFADRAFGMTERAVDNGELLAAEIASDAFAEVDGGRATFTDKDEYQRVVVASSALEALARVLGLKIEVPRPELKRRPEHIHDADIERATKTHELLGALGSQLGVDASRVDVRVDDQARERTAGQGIWGLMTDGTVFLDPDLYDPETSEGRHLLAHEVVHVAQLENRLRGANDAPDLFQAEAEADELSAMFAETGDIGMAPLASLARYDQAACGPREMATPKEPEPTPREPRKEVVVVPDLYKIVEDQIAVEPILFKVDKDQISETEEGAVPILQKAAKTIKSYPQITKLHIEGHTSTTATWDHNMKLSKGRAKSVKDWLADTGGVTISMSSEGYGEAVARKEQNIKDDRSSAEVKSQRKVIYRIIEVDGKAVPPGWKPTRQVIDVPGKTITRIFDADGKLISEEVVVNGAAGPENQSPGTAQGAAGTNPNQAAPAGQQNTSTGGTAPTQVQQTEVQPIIPGGPTQTETPAPTPPQPTGGGSDQVVFKQKVKPPKRDKKSRTPRRYAQGSIIAAQAKAGPGGLTTTDIANTSRSVGGGEPIPDGLRGRFETAFGANFSDVRIHRGSTQATGIGATAFARGTDIHFAPGRFDEGSSSGLAVLGHELTHIVQQRAGRVAVPQGKGTHVNVERVLEAEADLLGSRAARGESVHVQGSSAGLYARAARGEADTIQYEDGAGAAPAEAGGGTRPEFAEVRLGSSRIRARMPASGQQPGRITVDFGSAASVPGLTLKQASLVFNDQWEITEGHIMSSVAIGTYVNCEDVRLSVTQREDASGKYAELAAEVNDAQFKIEGLLDSRINLRLATSGISGSAHVEFAQMTIGQNITLTGGALDFTLTPEGSATVAGSVNGTIAVGAVSLNVELRGQAMTDGHLSAGATISLANPVPVPGVEGVTIVSGQITGSYVHNQQWSVTGNLVVNARDWVEADITATYTQPAGEGGAAAPAQWELRGMLRQLQAYTVGEGENQLTFENGELDFHFKNGEFLQVDARTDYTTTNWQGRLTGTFNVPQSKLTATGTINLRPPELPIGTGGIKFTRVAAVATITDNVLEQITGGATLVFPYQDQSTFKLDGTDITYRVQTSKVTGTASVTTLRDLPFGDTAGYNGVVKSGAAATLSVADNQLLGISGGLAFEVNHQAAKIGEGTVDINFDGPSQQLNATATFTLTAEGGFGVPDRVTGPVMLLPGGTFQLSIANNALDQASVRNVNFEVKQAGEGATGKIAGTVNGNYSFKTSKLTATGNAHLVGDWPLAPAAGVTLVFKEGGTIDVAVTENTLTRVHGDFPYEATIAPQGRVPEIQLEGALNGDYSDESKKFSGALTGRLKNNVVIPVNNDTITIKTGSNFTATVANSVPETFAVSFDCDYTRAGALFCSGHVENASYNFRTGDFDFVADLTLRTKIEKQTDDGKWKFVVNENSQVGVKVERSELKLITGSIDFEIHDATGPLFNGHLTEARVNVQDLKFSGTLDLALARNLTYPRTPEGAEAPAEGTPPIQAVAKKDVSHIRGTVANNVLTEVSAALMFGVNLAGVEYGAGELTGTLNMQSFQFGGTGKINLVKDLMLGGEETNAAGDPIASWHLCFPAGQGLDVTIAANHLDEANINLNAKLLHNMEEVANGSVSGRYKLGDTAGFNGEINANVIKDVDLTQDERWHYWLETGTTFRAVMSNSALQSANGNFSLRMDEIPEGNRPAIRVAIGGGYTKGTGFSAGGGITALNDIKVGQGDTYKFFIGKDSAGQATVAGVKVTSLTGSLTLNVKKGEDLFATGSFNLNYNNNDAAAVLNCDGQVNLVARTEVTPDGVVDWKFFLDPATGVGFKVSNNDLEYIKGQVNFAVSYKNVESITGNVYVEYLNKPVKEVNSNGQVQVTHEMRVADDLPGGFKIVIEPGTGANFNVEHSSLKTIGGSIKVRIEDATPLARVELNGTYTHAPTRSFDGGGSITLIRKIEVGASDDGKYTFNILEGTGATATVAASKLTQVTGSLLANIEDTGGEFARFNGQVTANRPAESWKLTAEGLGLTVNRPKEFDLRAGWKVTLLPGTGATVNVRDNALQSLGGSIKVQVDRGTDLSAEISVGGEYTPGAGITGEGSAKLLKDFPVGTRAPYSFIAKKDGTQSHINVAGSAIQRVGGSVNFLVKKGEDDFVLGTASIDYDVAGSSLVEARGNGVLANDVTLGDAGGFTLVACAQSSAHFLAQNGSLINVGGNLNLRLKKGTLPLAEGVVNAEFDVQGSKFTGDGEVHLINDYALSAEGLNGHGQPESWGLAIKTGSKLSLAIVENVFQQAHIDVLAAGYHNGVAKANGRITADYTLGDPNGVTGHVELNVTERIPLLEGGRFNYQIEPTTSFSGDAANGAITTVTGNFKLAVCEGEKDKIYVTGNATYTKGAGVTGGGTVAVVDPVLIKEGGVWKLWLDAGSGGNATVAASKLEEVNGQIKLRADKGEEKFATGNFTASYRVSDGRGAQTTATGTVALLGKVDVTPPGAGTFKVYLTSGTGIAASVTNGELDYVDGAIAGELEWKSAKLANFNLTAKYQASGTADFSGRGTFETTNAVKVASFGGYDLKIGVGANVGAKVTAFALDELSANIPLELCKGDVKYVAATLNGLYKHANTDFSGEGRASVVKQITIAENVGSKGYSFYLNPKSEVHAVVQANALQEVGGMLEVVVGDAPGQDALFLKATAQATYHGGEAPTVDAHGGLDVTRDKKMLTTANGYVVWLKIGSGAHVDVAANELTGIGGTVKIEIEKGGPFAKIELACNYTPTDGFSGHGSAELLQEVKIASTRFGEDTFTVWVMPGTGATVDLQASDIKHVGARVNAMIRDAEGTAGNFIGIAATADYDFPGKNFSGNGAITVLKPKKLATFAGNQLWLAPGGGASGSVANNNLQRVNGNLTLQLKDETVGHWLTATLDGGFDAEGGTGFSGSGTVTVHKDKELARLGDYKFCLAAGAGASATIAANKLTEVHGNVPFKIYDAKAEPLITGSAEGHYYSDTKKFSGSGDIRLGRDVEFPIGGGKLVFKKGSGGGGTVTDNELRRLSGTLKVDIWDSTGAIVGLEAEGTFNAVTNKIERLQGTASLLRPIDVGGTGANAFLRIETLTGTALVENNELKELSGALDIVLPRLNNMRGHFEGGWQKGAGTDIFWGSGWIQFTLFDDAATGRKLSGKVDGSYQKNGNFNIHGNVDYKLNHMIGGSLGVEVDQNLDPILSGTLVVSNVTLVQGRDLFKWGKDFTLLRTTVAAGPVPIAMAGGVNVGIGLSMLPLTFGASIGVRNFKPLSQNVKVPDFTARAELSTGLRMAASLKPWFSIGVGIAGVASAGLALQGEASIGVDVNVTPYAELVGEGGVYSGTLGVGLNVVGSGALAITPQVYAELLGNRWPYDLAELRHELGPLFSFDYNYSFPFGDRPAAPTQGGATSTSTTTAAAESRKIEGHKTPPPADAATSGAANRPAAVPGGADMNAASPDSQQGAQREGPMGELMQKIDSIQEWGAKIGAIAKVGGDLVNMLMFMITIPPPFGIAVAGAYLAYKLISGGLTIESIVLAATTVWDLITSIDVSALASLLPDWLVSLWNQIKGKSLDELLIGMIDTMAEWLSNTFPSAEPVISVLAGVARTVIQTIARIITAILSGNFGVGTFLDICRTIGGSVLGAVVQMAAEAAAAAVAAAAGAVVDFVASLW